VDNQLVLVRNEVSCVEPVAPTMRGERQRIGNSLTPNDLCDAGAADRNNVPRPSHR
jgi:hypothetical protein